MAFSGLDIYKLLPKTNCRDCGFATCLAFAMQLAKKSVTADKCSHLSEEAKIILENAALAPIKLITIGKGENKLEVGNETVIFRHEEKFRSPCGLGIIIKDSLSDQQIKEKLDKINHLKFERVGQVLSVNCVAISQSGNSERFIKAVKLVFDNTLLPLVLISADAQGISGACEIAKDNLPLIYCATKDNLPEFGELAKRFNLALAVSSPDLESMQELTKELIARGVNDLILDTGNMKIADKIWDLTQIRSQALKKSNRLLGFPALAITQSSDPYEEAMEASAYLAKYAGIVLISGEESFEVLSILTLRQNIYTDPQKPLQIEPKLYTVGPADKNSPLLVTTNFSLSYYTVLGEVEASKIPAHILSVDTQGMSVLTAWAAEKFTAETITQSLNKNEVSNALNHKRVIIPGYVAVLSGDLQEESGFEVIVGPKEAAGIPSFLKNLN
ncbi:MAG: acetyl-CoA decarbonylase/synthase complex subunit gamma [Candidatus Omnitrophica bacterium]|jgi:acetyl-CoA decarbonylase/synthase complex subunit gamma|nr:acetyl-CoA decarbonylase/synthase complex subunit gamma [Candidatus Omnitrophota bacterium]